MTPCLEPDQVPASWDGHVEAYETIFEPFTLALSAPALNSMVAGGGGPVLDVCAGPGAAALELARRGAVVTACDASPAMVARISRRAALAGLAIDAQVMDAAHLEYPDGAFDAAMSAFGIVLLVDAVGALAEMRRVVRRGGRVAVVTWTEPQSYELAAALSAAMDQVWPDRPRPPLPAQLRYREREMLSTLFTDAGLPPPRIELVESCLRAPSARWLAENLAFAPGMAALLAGLGDRRVAALDAFISVLEARFAEGRVELGGKAFVAIAETS